MEMLAQGTVEKMTASLSSVVDYQLPIGDMSISLNPLIGKKIQLQYLDAIYCLHCQRLTKKSFNQGYCYPCFQKLACCDSCIMSPEKCHYSLGTCREPEWAQTHCLVEHIIYLSNTSGPKVGITRATQLPTRWIDQGAIQALPLISVRNRHHSGLIERAFREHVADRTSWQTMLKGDVPLQNLTDLRDKLLFEIKNELGYLQNSFGSDVYTLLLDATVTDIHFPVTHYPLKIKSLDFDKQPLVAGVLQGIKGQYLLLDTGVINIRKFTAYQISFSTL